MGRPPRRVPAAGVDPLAPRTPRIVVVVIGASTASLDAVRQLLEPLPADCPAAFAITLHMARIPREVGRIARWPSQLTVEFAEDGLPLKPAHVYIAPFDQHMLLHPLGHLSLQRGPAVHRMRPAIDPLFQSAAASHGPRVIGVLLQRQGRDGELGLRAVADAGGIALIEKTAAAGIASARAELLPLRELIVRVGNLCR
jgi:two-component system, chemotaxis family, protein-glutamate methylesterase/glutaminase